MYNLFYFPKSLLQPAIVVFIAQSPPPPLKGQFHEDRKWARVNHSFVPSTWDCAWHIAGAKYIFK